MNENKRKELIKFYRENPIEFIEEFSGVKLYWYQKFLFKHWYKKPNYRNNKLNNFNKMFDK